MSLETAQSIFGSDYRVFAEMPGGMAVVYGVQDLRTGERFAAKTHRFDRSERQDELEALFHREVEISTRIGAHPNILLARFARRFGGRLFLFTTFVDGGPCGSTLRDWMDAGALTFEHIKTCTRHLALGMEHLSSKGAIAHLDLKPENLLVSAEPQLMIADFGIARRVAPFVTVPSAEARGALAYMAPEHLAGRVIDERADVYSCGVILYEMLTGRLPFERDSGRPTDQEIRAFHRDQSIATELYYKGELYHPLLPEIASSASAAMGNVGTLLSGMLAADPGDRFSTFADVRRAVESAFPVVRGQTRARTDTQFEDLLREALALQELGKHSEALTSLNRALRLAPNDLRALKATSVSLRAQGLDGPAESFARRVRAIEASGTKEGIHGKL